MQKMFFLSGIPRAGSTLLGSILNQNPEVYVSPTSPLFDLYCNIDATFDQANKIFTFEKDLMKANVCRDFYKSFYSHIKKPYVFDKGRAWPKNIKTIKSTLEIDPKILWTYRPISEGIVSFIRLGRNVPDNHIDRMLKQQNKELTDSNRAMLIWEQSYKQVWENGMEALKQYRECIHLVEYQKLVEQPKETLENVYKFLEIAPHEHKFVNIENTCAENDENWGLPGLHDIRPEIKRISLDPKEILDPMLIKYFDVIDSQIKEFLV